MACGLLTSACSLLSSPLTDKGRIFTTGEVGWQDVAHVEGGMGQKKDYSQVIQAALVRSGHLCPPLDAPGLMVLLKLEESLPLRATMSSKGALAPVPPSRHICPPTPLRAGPARLCV